MQRMGCCLELFGFGKRERPPSLIAVMISCSLGPSLNFIAWRELPLESKMDGAEAEPSKCE